MKEQIEQILSRLSQLEQSAEDSSTSTTRTRSILDYPGIYRPVTPSDRDAILSVVETSASNFTIQQSWFDTAPQTANNFYGPVWMANIACTVISVKERHEDNASGALTLDVSKDGSTLLSSAFNIAANAGSTNTGTLTGTPANLSFAIGDRLHVGVSGSVAGIRGLCVVVEFEPV